MRTRQPPPRLWLVTDERMGDALWTALGRLPRGGGVVFRHHATPPAARRALFRRVRAIARARRLTLVLAGPPRDAIGWRADGAHGPSPHRRAARPLVRTAPAHDRAALTAAKRAEADIAFLSPVFPTRSHPGAATLGPVRFGLAAREAGRRAPPLVALGGMDARRFRRLAPLGAGGWAAIDAWTGRPPA